MSQAPQEPEDLGWPLPEPQARAWRRRHRRQLSALFGACGLVAVGALQLALHGPALRDPQAGWARLAIWTLPALLLAPALAALATVWRQRRASAGAEVGLGLTRRLLAPGERPRLLVPAMWLERSYAEGWLLLTDRRLVRLHLPLTLFRRPWPSWAPLCARSELLRAEVVQRRACRGALAREVLRLFATDRGLRLRATAGRAWFLACEREQLEHLAPRLRAEGIPVEEVDDRDLPAPVPLTPVELLPLPARAPA